MLKKRIVQYWTTIKDTCKKHKKTALAILLIIAVAASGSVGYKLMTATDSGVASNEKKLEQAKEAEEEAVSEEKKAEEELEKAKKSGDKEAIEKAEKKVEQAKKKVTSAKKEVASSSKGSSGSNSSASKPSSSKPSNSSGSSSSSGGSSASKPSKPSGGSSGSSGSSGSNSSGSSTSKPSKPAHQHKWEPVYDTKIETKTKEVPYSVEICDTCGVENPTDAHLKDHLFNDGGYNTHREVRYKTETYEEKVKFIAYYICSCGKTKNA